MRSKDGDHDTVKGGLESGAIVFVEGGQDETNTEPLAAENIYNSRTRAFTDRQRIIGSTGTWFWFGDHVSPNPLPALYGGSRPIKRQSEFFTDVVLFEYNMFVIFGRQET